MFNLYYSSEPDSTGGVIAGQVDLLHDIVAHVQAITEPSDEPSSCFAGRFYRKFFLRNDGTETVPYVFVNLTEPPKAGNSYHVLGTVDDTTPPDDAEFETVFGQGRSIQCTNIAPGDTIPIWFVMLWKEATGWTTDLSVKLELVTGASSEPIEFFYKLDLYVEPFTKDTENDYTSWLKDLFIIFLRNALYQTPRLDFRWHPYAPKTQIFISDRLTYNLEEPEMKPSIVVVRGGLAWRDLVMDQLKTYDMIDRTNTRTDFIMGNMTLQCVAREGLHAESLATMLFKMLKFYKDDLRSMGIHEIQRVNIGEEINIMGDTRPEAVMVPVNVAVVFQDTWKTWINWPRLRGIDLKVNTPEQFVNIE